MATRATTVKKKRPTTTGSRAARSAGTAVRKSDRVQRPSRPQKNAASKKVAGKNAGRPKAKKKAVSSRDLAKIHLKRGVRTTLYGATVIATLFTAVMVAATLFLVYQWKEYRVTETVKEIKNTEDAILRLHSENSRLQATINTRLKTNQRILKVTQERFGMDASRNRSVLRVNRKALEHYVQKDQKAQKQNLRTEPLRAGISQ